MKKLFTVISVIFLSILSTSALSADADVAVLNDLVQAEAQHIEAKTGILPTATELETIESDIVFDEIQSTSLTTDQAVQKYELNDDQKRYLMIKAARSSDAIRPCPCP